jgi:hypothetical protein
VCGADDCADSALVVQTGHDVSGVAVTVSNKFAQISGMITTPPTQHPTDLVIVVFSAELSLRGLSRRTMVTRPGTDGRYTAGPLPAGRYYVAAVREIADNDWFNPGVLESLVAAATPVTLAAGELKIQDFAVR